MNICYRSLGLVLLSLFLCSCSALSRPQSPTPPPPPTLAAGARACAEPPAGLLSWWPADGNANDLQGVNDGAMSDGATFAAGLAGQAFSFDGTTTVSAPTTGLPTGYSDRTLDLWVKVKAFSDGETFFAGYGRFGSLGRTYHLGTTGQTLFFSQWGQALFGPELQPGRWYHVAVTNVGTSVTLYLDGAAVAGGELGIDTPGGTQFFLGSLPADPAKRLDGLIDEAAIYDRALSAAEIQAIFLAGHDGRCQ